jgi:prefoldin subunit 5
MCYIIDPLRETIKVLEDQLTAITAERDELRAERDRYRDALERMKQFHGDNDRPSPEWFINIAHEALKEKP